MNKLKYDIRLTGAELVNLIGNQTNCRSKWMKIFELENYLNLKEIKKEEDDDDDDDKKEGKEEDENINDKKLDDKSTTNPNENQLKLNEPET